MAYKPSLTLRINGNIVIGLVMTLCVLAKVRLAARVAFSQSKLGFASLDTVSIDSG